MVTFGAKIFNGLESADSRIVLNGDELDLTETKDAGLVGRWKYSRYVPGMSQAEENNAARKALLDMALRSCGKASFAELPESVKKAFKVSMFKDDMKLNADGDVTSGRPLTKRRITCVMDAVKAFKNAEMQLERFKDDVNAFAGKVQENINGKAGGNEEAEVAEEFNSALTEFLNDLSEGNNLVLNAACGIFLANSDVDGARIDALRQKVETIDDFIDKLDHVKGHLAESTQDAAEKKKILDDANRIVDKAKEMRQALDKEINYHVVDMPKLANSIEGFLLDASKRDNKVCRMAQTLYDSSWFHVKARLDKGDTTATDLKTYESFSDALEAFKVSYLAADTIGKFQDALKRISKGCGVVPDANHA